MSTLLQQWTHKMSLCSSFRANPIKILKNKHSISDKMMISEVK